MTKARKLQELLIEEILNRFIKKSEAAAELMDVLSINRDGVYRRLRGDTILSAPEIQTLATHFDISLDKLLSHRDHKTSFSYNIYRQPIKTFGDFLHHINWLIEEFSQKTKVEVHYASREIPIFIYMMFPKVLALKLYIYGLTNWSLDHLEDRKFSFELVSPKDLEIAQATSNIYCSINSSDYWTLSILEQSLNQVEYMSLEGRFEKQEDAFAICAEILEMINHCRAMAEIGKKFMPKQLPGKTNGKFELFHNELTGTSNTILAISEQYNILYHTLDAPNFLYTTDQHICASMNAWFKRIGEKSTPISIHSSKNRNYFFNRLENKVKQAVKRLEISFAQ